MYTYTYMYAHQVCMCRYDVYVYVHAVKDVYVYISSVWICTRAHYADLLIASSAMALYALYEYQIKKCKNYVYVYVRV